MILQHLTFQRNDKTAVFLEVLFGRHLFSFALFPAARASRVALCVVLFDVEAGVSVCLACQIQPSKRRHTSEKVSSLQFVQLEITVENHLKMDQIMQFAEPLRQFSKDSLRLVKRCTKPDRKGEKGCFNVYWLGFYSL